VVLSYLNDILELSNYLSRQSSICFGTPAEEKRKRVMLTLFCMIIGAGDAFPIDIEEDKSVGYLKKKSRKKK
jgi:Crinkler effector protein N-terminal domain